MFLSCSQHSEFLAVNWLCILTTLICGKRHLQVQNIFLDAVARLIVNAKEMRTVAHSFDTLWARLVVLGYLLIFVNWRDMFDK